MGCCSIMGGVNIDSDDLFGAFGHKFVNQRFANAATGPSDYNNFMIDFHENRLQRWAWYKNRTPVLVSIVILLSSIAFETNAIKH
jgi:hypothetical protein